MLVDDPNHDIQTLVEQVQQGDTAALERLLTWCRMRLRRYFRTRTRTHEDCEDLIQETLLRVADALPRTHLNAPFDHWLYRIAANRLISYYSRSHHQREISFSHFEEAESVEGLQHDSLEASLLDRVADEQTHAMIVRIIKEVCSDAERRVILMHAQHEPLDTIAQLLGMNPATVRSHLMRGRSKVLAYLIQNCPHFVGGREGIQQAVESLERDGATLSDAEREALQAPKPNQTALRSAALKLAKYLKF